MTTMIDTANAPVAAYDAARKKLEALEAAQARAADVAGEAPADLATRLERARRELAPLELSYCDHELALLAEEARTLDREYERSQEAVRRAEARRAAALQAARRNDEVRRDLEAQRRRAWHRAHAYETGANPDASPTPAPVVCLGWQAPRGDSA